MTALDAPDPGEAHHLLNPRRSAHATIRGYLYQTCLGVLRWLELKPSEILLCEGDEDLDHFLLGGEAVSEQVKDYTGELSLSDSVVRESLGNFLRTYVALRRRGDNRRFVFTTTAHEKKRRIGRLNFDLLEAWKAGSRKPEVLDAVRSLLEPREDNKNYEETTEAIAWLDTEPEGWKGFMNAVEWSFDAPDLDAIRTQVKNRLAKRADTTDLPAETFLERLIAHVLRTSSQPKPEDRMLDSKSLSGLIETARTDLGNWVKTPAAERLRTVFDELKQVQRLLHDNTRSLPELVSPGKLLTAAYEVIPFDEAGRREELDFLTGWCDGDDRQSVLLLTGEGGSGKTRLMIEWCRQLRHLGWHAGFFRPDRKAEDLDPLLEGVAPRFIVIDYAETRLPVVEPLLLKLGLQAEGEGPKLRLVLLARRQADWWENLPRAGQQVEDLLLRSPEPRAITPLLPKDMAERERAFRIAVKGFSFQLGLKRPTDLPIPDLSRSEFERVLYLHMAALAALQGERIETADGLLKQTLAHERQFWYDNGGIFGSQRILVSDAFESVVAAVTLIGGISTLDALSLVPRILKDSPVSPSDAFLMPVTLITLYAGPRDEKENRTVVEPLQPDLLGEELVAEALSRDEGLLGRVLDGAKPEEAYSTLTVLTRLAQRSPKFKHWIELALNGRLEALAETALNVATETGDPVGLVLAKQLESSTSLPLLIKLVSRCEQLSLIDSITIQEAAIAATLRLNLLSTNREQPTQNQRCEIARSAINLSKRFQRLEQHESALCLAQQGAEMFAALAQEDVKYNYPLTLALVNLGTLKGSMGDYDFGIPILKDAIASLRVIPEDPEVLPQVAGALANLGLFYSQVGRKEALTCLDESIQIYEQLAKQNSLYYVDLSGGLINLSIALAKAGKFSEALKVNNKAVELLEQAQRERPDISSSYLAEALHGYGCSFFDLGQLEEAAQKFEQAIILFRQLAGQRPSTFAPKLANSLSNLCDILCRLGKFEAAIIVSEEAVTFNRQLANSRPEVFFPRTAFNLNQQAIALSSLERNEDAARAAHEAMQLLSHCLPETLAGLDIDAIGNIAMNYIIGQQVIGQEPSEELLSALAERLGITFPIQE